MKFKLKISPTIHPKTRHRIEDLLTAEGFTVIGGGQTLNCDTKDSYSDISFERADPRDKDNK